jgi:hypothetical protein
MPLNTFYAGMLDLHTLVNDLAARNPETELNKIRNRLLTVRPASHAMEFDSGLEINGYS